MQTGVKVHPQSKSCVFALQLVFFKIYSFYFDSEWFPFMASVALFTVSLQVGE